MSESRFTDALAANGLDALVCALPSNVLLLSGYWPLIGNALALVTREGFVAVVAPEDEQEFALESWADTLQLFQGGLLDSQQSTSERVRPILGRLTKYPGFGAGCKVGFEGGAAFDPFGYASTFSYGAGMRDLLAAALPGVKLHDATGCLARLRSVLTPCELDRVRQACGQAGEAFISTAPAISAGMREYEIPGMLRAKLTTGSAGNSRSGGFAYCMSGPNSAEAYAAFQQSRSRPFRAGRPRTAPLQLVLRRLLDRYYAHVFAGPE